MKFIGTLFGWLFVLALIILAVAFVFVLCGVHLKKKSDTRNKPSKNCFSLRRTKSNWRRSIRTSILWWVPCRPIL